MMTKSELRDEISQLLDEVDLEIMSDMQDLEHCFSFNETISYLFFIRAIELFQGIIVLIKHDQVIPAAVILRSLSEAYILMKASMRDEDFNDRHLKHAAIYKEKWIDKTIADLSKSGFDKGADFFENIKLETQQLHEGLEKCMEQVYQLFRRHDELAIYLQIYSPASLYVHGNRQSFRIYHGENDTVKPTVERDYSGLYRHTGFSAVHIMFKSYELFCEVLKRKETISAKIQARIKISTIKVVADMKIAE